MIKKLLGLIRENRKNQKEIIAISRELNWANVYHDSIRGKKYLENLSLNIGRWGCNYAFFYVLNRILSDLQPKSILELGLGESTKFISVSLEKENPKCRHLVLEQDNKWKTTFLSKNEISSNSEIRICEVKMELISGHETCCFKDFKNVVSEKFDLYIVDGPIGTKRFSRYDLVRIAESLEPGDDFIIMVDDYQRKGEKETVETMLAVFRQKGLDVHVIGFHSIKHMVVVTTEKYKHVSSF